ncbi:hypothetical protein GNI_034750 [Gregarina niphandrodes]|uniref:Uncharacterized protein n=1 Tax=Gregarina niphandrodes TaxID=110365 RepID=A0A023BAZ0_GRENI|nr:hypothetical protein GNI_034750 [Gregarina niphandrodes]EZG78562.1 hypothetical protein GNI_034750 [Gregarina niphandrodes]|eukprot:XP_011129248.1 hypothetical protein GNI_034750 [Gregarina niphandrodes]
MRCVTGESRYIPGVVGALVAMGDTLSDVAGHPPGVMDEELQQELLQRCSGMKKEILARVKNAKLEPAELEFMTLAWLATPWEDSRFDDWLNETLGLTPMAKSSSNSPAATETTNYLVVWVPPVRESAVNVVHMVGTFYVGLQEASAQVQLADGTIVTVRPYNWIKHRRWRNDRKLAWRVTAPNGTQYHSSARSKPTKPWELPPSVEDGYYTLLGINVHRHKRLLRILGPSRYKEFVDRFLRLCVDYGRCSGVLDDGRPFRLVQSSGDRYLWQIAGLVIDPAVGENSLDRLFGAMPTEQDRRSICRVLSCSS